MAWRSNSCRRHLVQVKPATTWHDARRRDSFARMSNINPNPFTTRPEIEGTFGVVTSTHWIATAVGMAMLEKGGNAFDAAVATAFTLQVVEPHLNGPGGDVPVIVYDVQRGKPEVICGQGPAPAGATIAHYRKRRPRSRTRHRASRRLRARHIRNLDADACATTARCGCARCWRRRSATRRTAIRWSSAPARPSPRSPNCFANIGRLRPRSICRNGAVPPTGTLFTNTTLAATYRRILERSRKRRRRSHRANRAARGNPGRKVSLPRRSTASAARRRSWTSSGTRHRGVLTGDDMARWTPRIEAPLTYDYGRYTRVQDRTVGTRPGDAAAARAAQRLRS